MMPQSENGGGLIGQLRGYALMGSDEGSWKEAEEQTSVFGRSMTLRGESNQSVDVSFEARKVRRGIGGSALRTIYTLRGSYVENNIIYECMPQSAIELLRQKKVHAGEGGQETNIISIHSEEDEEIDEYEFEDYEDMNFRHVRSVEYRLNGRGSVLNCAREDFYEDDDAGSGVEIIASRTNQAGTFENEEMAMLTLGGWGKRPVLQQATDFILHPDLQALEIENSVQELRTDMVFLSIIGGYALDKKLLQHTRREQRQAMTTMLAFLRGKASVKDIQDLL